MEEKKVEITISIPDLELLIKTLTNSIESGGEFMNILWLIDLRQKLVNRYNEIPKPKFEEMPIGGSDFTE